MVFGWKYDGDTYPRGSRVFFGSPQSGDFFFGTYGGVFPTLTLTLTGCTSCKAGDIFSLNATFMNPAPKPMPVEIKAGVVLPDGTEFNIWVVADKHFTVDLPAGLDVTVELLRVTIPSGLPNGPWGYEGALISPELGRTLSRDTKSFTIQ